MTKSFLSAPFYAIGMRDDNIRSEIEMITIENFRKVLTWKTFDIRDVHWFFTEAKIYSKSLSVTSLKLESFFKYCRIRPLVFSFSPFQKRVAFFS